jgi:hypothetical protein
MRKIILFSILLCSTLPAYQQEPRRSDYPTGAETPDHYSRVSSSPIFTEDDRRTLYKMEGQTEGIKSSIDRIYLLQNVLITMIVGIFVGSLVIWRQLITVQTRVDGIYEILKGRFPNA